MAGTFLCSLLLLSHLMPQEPTAGIDRELARSRKAAIADVEYDLTFQLQNDADSVTGDVYLRFRLAEDVVNIAPVVLDFAGDELTVLSVNGREGNLRQTNGHIIVPGDQLVPGINGMRFAFRSAVAPTGTPLTVYRDSTDDRDYYYTLLVPADAHRLFPCFDQPDLRARFQLVLDLPPDWTAVANSPPFEPDERVPKEGVGKLWHFEPTKPLPTYLFAFACGPFASISQPHPDVPGVDTDASMRFLLRNSRIKDFDRETVVRLHHEGLRWLANAFDVPYPFGKLDVVLLPGFPYGGMEHAGAIFYRESALVFDHPPTVSEQVRRSTLVYHELSHQWFGNLVTMKWFDDLWLKEGFATFYGYRAMAELEPQQRAWLRFLQRVKPRAYAVDATPGTTPVYQELQNLADAKSAYGAIVYNKAPAVLRALFARLGPDVFRVGLRRFLTDHAYGNADWRDLAQALEGAARQDLGRWSERWLLAPSMPQVRVSWEADDDGVIASATVTQRPLGGEGSWPLDLELLVFERDAERRTLQLRSDEPMKEISELVGQPAPAAVLANPRDVAYGQFVPDAISSAWLLQNLAQEEDPLVRGSAVAALFEAVREAELDPAAFAELVLALLAIERDPDTHQWLLASLRTCLSRYLSPTRAAPLRQRAADLLLQQLEQEAGSGRELGSFRFLARASSDSRVLALCSRVIANDELPAGLSPGKQDCFLAAAARIAANAADNELEQLRQRFADQDIEKELFLALAATPTSDSKQSYWQRYLVADDPPEQWTQDSLSWFHWPGQQALTLQYLPLALEQVEWVKQNRRIFFMPAWLDAFINAHSSSEALAIVDRFVEQTELSDDVRRKLLQSRDGLARAVRIQAAFATAK